LKVAVAMSGGIDSSVAAALLKAEGYDVIGITMQVQPLLDRQGETTASGDSSVSDTIYRAREVADFLGIPHHIVDLRPVFTEKVVSDFCNQYGTGKTPNPCVRCNRYIKFGVLREKAKELGADLFATGHYARIEMHEDSGRYLLKKGIDTGKDQSYFLYALTQEQLSNILFPLGNLTKAETRRVAEDKGLPVTDRNESQEICFIPGNDYHAFLQDYSGHIDKPGAIQTIGGEVIGEHSGISRYTIGQRKGLGIANDEPLYVIDIKPERNIIVVGNKNSVYTSELTAAELNWIAVDNLKQTMRVSARIRYRHREAEAVINPLSDNRVDVRFDTPQMAITPGQAVVFYDDETVIGGGVIERRPY